MVLNCKRLLEQKNWIMSYNQNVIWACLFDVWFVCVRIKINIKDDESKTQLNNITTLFKYTVLIYYSSFYIHMNCLNREIDKKNLALAYPNLMI